MDAAVDDEAEVAWQDEIARRLQDVESGKVKTIPLDEVRRKGRTLFHGK